MSQSVGLNYKSRIPTFGDDASIEEALKVYHYGVDNYTTQAIPDDSIEGNFRTLNTRITAVENGKVNLISLSASPNILIGQTTTTVPVTVRAIASQSVNLQNWQNSSSTNIATMSTTGALGLASYFSVGSATVTSTTAVSVAIANVNHIGQTIRATGGQAVNMQEWQNSSGTAISWVDKDGKIYSDGSEVASGLGSLLLIGA